MKKIKKYPQDFKTARDNAHLSQEEAATKLGTSSRLIQYIEEDGRIPKTPLFLLSCAYFHLDPRSYMDLADEEAATI